MPIEVRDERADSARFEASVEPHLRVLSAVAVRLVGADDAADVVQEALLRAWRRRETYDATRGEFRAWLIAILVDRARRHRARWLRRAPDQELGVTPDHADRRTVDVTRAVRTLPRRQQEAVALFYLTDLPVADVATAMGITTGAVKSHLHAARTRLRELLEDT